MTELQKLRNFQKLGIDYAFDYEGITGQHNELHHGSLTNVETLRSKYEEPASYMHYIPYHDLEDYSKKDWRDHERSDEN